MPKKRPIDVRIAEARERVERLQDEKKLEDLRAKMARGRPNKRRRKTT